MGCGRGRAGRAGPEEKKWERAGDGVLGRGKEKEKGNEEGELGQFGLKRYREKERVFHF